MGSGWVNGAVEIWDVCKPGTRVFASSKSRLAFHYYYCTLGAWWGGAIHLANDNRMAFVAILRYPAQPTLLDSRHTFLYNG